jgi:hypothetical protein
VPLIAQAGNVYYLRFEMLERAPRPPPPSASPVTIGSGLEDNNVAQPLKESLIQNHLNVLDPRATDPQSFNPRAFFVKEDFGREDIKNTRLISP